MSETFRFTCGSKIRAREMLLSCTLSGGRYDRNLRRRILFQRQAYRLVQGQPHHAVWRATG